MNEINKPSGPTPQHRTVPKSALERHGEDPKTYGVTKKAPSGAGRTWREESTRQLCGTDTKARATSRSR